MIITEPFPAMLHFIRQRVPLDWSEDLRLIGQVQENEITAVIAYNGFMGKLCVMHVAGTGKRWINRELLWGAFDFPFNQCGLEVVLGLVPATNEEALRLDKHLGFRESHRIAGAGTEGEDIVILEMRRSQAEKWLALGERYGRQSPRSTACA